MNREEQKGRENQDSLEAIQYPYISTLKKATMYHHAIALDIIKPIKRSLSGDREA